MLTIADVLAHKNAGITLYYDACRAVLAHCPNQYAKAYARAGLNLSGHEARVQALYILNNITHWRTDEAKTVRGVLKSFSKGL